MHHSLRLWTLNNKINLSINQSILNVIITYNKSRKINEITNINLRHNIYIWVTKNSQKQKKKYWVLRLEHDATNWEKVEQCIAYTTWHQGYTKIYTDKIPAVNYTIHYTIVSIFEKKFTQFYSIKKSCRVRFCLWYCIQHEITINSEPVWMLILYTHPG